MKKSLLSCVSLPLVIVIVFFFAKNASAQNLILLDDSLQDPEQVFKLSNGYYVFAAKDDLHGLEPHSTDGTATGTQLLKDIKPGSATSFQEPLYFSWAAAFDSVFLFNATDSVNGQIWITNGTPAGTKKLIDTTSDVFTCCADFYPETLNGKIFFVGADDTYPQHNLWITDGTKQGTTEFADSILPRAANSNPDPSSEVLNNIFYFFSATNTVGLWRSDGTSNGTYKLTNTISASDANVYSKMIAYNNKIYFSVYDSIHGNELWSTDGTVLNTSIVADLDPGAHKDSGPRDLTLFQNQLLFATNAIDSDYHTKGKLWRTDGTANGTFQVALAGNTSISQFVSVIGATSGILYFNVYRYDSSYNELWRTDGTDSGTWKLNSFPPLGDNYYFIDESIDWNGEFYFVVSFGSSYGATSSLWRSDGTVTGTYSVHDNTDEIGYPPSIISLNIACDTLFFLEYDDYPYPEKYQLWMTDGTAFHHINFFTGIPEETTILLNDQNQLFLGMNSDNYYTYYSPQPFLLKMCEPYYTVSPPSLPGNFVKVFPNPTNQMLDIEMSFDSTPLDNLSIRVSDLLGKTFYNAVYPPSKAGNNYEINLENFPANVYILDVRCGNKTWVQKIVKQ